MTKVLFFIHNGWVFGKIHNEAIKHLWPDVDCDILDWNHPLTHEEAFLLQQKYDYILSLPDVCFMLHSKFSIPFEQLIGVAHSDFDIYKPIRQQISPEEFQKLRGYAVISPVLRNISLAHGIPRVPTLLPVGVNCQQYRKPPATEIRQLGYLGKLARTDQTFDLKRGCLAQQVAEQVGLPLFHRENIHFLAVEPLYKTIDLLMFCSLTEGNPYPALEAMAAGIPVLGTHVGLFPELTRTGAGVILPMEEEKYVAEAVAVIRALQADHGLYLRMHEQALKTSLGYDWSTVRDIWVSYIQSL